MFGLKRETDYAVQLLQYLRDKKNFVSLKEFSQKSGISFWFLQKIARRLNLAGMVEAGQGVKGGYCLSPAAKKLTLYKVFEVMEGKPAVTPCLGCRDYKCNNFNKKCDVKEMGTKLNKGIIKEMHKIKI